MTGLKWEDAQLHLQRTLFANIIRELRAQGTPHHLLHELIGAFKQYVKDTSGGK